MTSRERIDAAINQKPVDRVPMDMTITFDAYNNFVRHQGWDHLVVDNALANSSVVFPAPEFYDRMNIDCIWVPLKPPSRVKPFKYGQPEFVSEWGQTFKKVLQNGITEYEVASAPLTDLRLEDLEDYDWPNPEEDCIFDGLLEKCKDLYENTDKALVGFFGGSIFTLPSLLRGMEEWMVDLIAEPEFAKAVISKFCDYYTRLYCKALSIAGRYISIVRMDYDDYGTQNGPLISPQMFRDQIMPYHKKFYDAVRETLHKENPNGKLMKHSCGDNLALIDDYVAMGMDILDPLQPRTRFMSREKLGAYKGRIVFHGGIDTQVTLPSGTPQDVAKDVKDAIKNYASPSGYIVATAHHVPGDVPPDNIIALRDAVLEYGKVKDGRLVNLGS